MNSVFKRDMYGSLVPAVGAAIYSYHKRLGLELVCNYEKEILIVLCLRKGNRKGSQ